MGFYEDAKRGLARLIGNQSEMARKTKVSQSTISRFLGGGGGSIRADQLGRMLDHLGARIVFPDEGPSDTTRSVCFVKAQTMSVEAADHLPVPEDYFAVPLAAGPASAPTRPSTP